MRRSGIRGAGSLPVVVGSLPTTCQRGLRRRGLRITRDFRGDPSKSLFRQAAEKDGLVRQPADAPQKRAAGVTRPRLQQSAIGSQLSASLSGRRPRVRSRARPRCHPGCRRNGWRCGRRNTWSYTRRNLVTLGVTLGVTVGVAVGVTDGVTLGVTDGVGLGVGVPPQVPPTWSRIAPGCCWLAENDHVRGSWQARI